jgi:aspartate/methionine/tyrosine aminotransferase
MKDYTTLSHCGIGEVIAEKLLTNKARYIKRNMGIRQDNLKALNEWAGEEGDLLNWAEPTAGFTIFPKYRCRLGSSKLCERLLKEEGVLLSPGDHFGVEKHLRINIGMRGESLPTGLERLARFMRRILK